MGTHPHKATNVDTTDKEFVLDLVNIHAKNMDPSDRAALRGVNNVCRRFISENATKLVCAVSKEMQ
jgi:hypothetical protein